MKIIILLALIPIVAIWGQTTTSTSTTTTLIPKTQFVVVSQFRIRPGQPFNVVVTRSGVVKSIAVKLTLSGQTKDGIQITPIVRTASISSTLSRVVVAFDVSKFENGDYFLTAEGEGYTEKRALTFATSNVQYTMEINRAIFNPGQLLKGRVYAYDFSTNAINPKEKCKIAFKDSSWNSISVLQDLLFVNGKHEFQLQLSSKPPMGTWFILLECGLNGENSFTKSFEVAEFVARDYELIVKIPERISKSLGKVPVIITAKYTFGPPVNGEGVFINSVNNYIHSFVNRTVPIVNGSASFEIDMLDLNVSPSGYQYGAYYQYFFTMKDSLLGTVATTEGYFIIVPYSYTLEWSAINYFIPGASFNYKVIMKTLDGKPAPLGTKVNITIQPDLGIKPILLTADGTYSSTVLVPTTVTSLTLIADAPDSMSGMHYASSPYLGTFYSIGVTSLQRSYKINEMIQITISVAETVDFINYFFTVKGILITSDRIGFPVGKKQTTISFKATYAHVPSVSVIVYYINKNGDFVTGIIDLEVKDKFPNYVKFNFTEVSLKPGDDFTFTVESKCDSTVSLNAIDQRLILTKKGHNVDINEIFGNLQGYQWRDRMVYDSNRIYENVDYNFQSYGCMIMTNIPSSYSRNNLRSDSSGQLSDSIIGGDAPSLSSSVFDNGVKVRSDFTENFCWVDAVTSTNTSTATICNTKVTCTLPDNLSKYMFYSVAMNTKYGIGVSETTSNVTLSIPFSLNLQFPETIQRNEVLLTDIPFFNKIAQDQNIVISIAKSDRFEVVDLATHGWTETATEYTRTYAAKALTDFKIQCALKPMKVGLTNIRVVAKGPLAGDAVERILNVIFEGIPRSITKSAFITLQDGENNEISNLECVYPPGAYEDSKQVLATATGDLLGNALNNLENLISMPGGCGEQTLLGLVPDLAIHDYLRITGKLTPEIEAMLIQYEQVGYQNQLSARRSDGGFSAFGQSDPFSSTWLSIYTAKSLYDARQYIYIDMDVVQGAIDFVMNQQDETGKFNEPGRVIHTEMQGGTRNGIAMTAYITIQMQSLLAYFPQYYDQNQNAIAYLASQAASITNVYELGIIAYALKLAGQEPEATQTFNSFYALRVESSSKIQWTVTENPPNLQYYSSLDVEVSSYGLKLMIEYNRIDDAIKVARYLVSQQTQNGGFGSSQDTVIAIQALSLFAIITSANGDIQLQMTPNVGSPFNVNIDSTNALTLHQFTLDPSTTQLETLATTSSTGYAVVSLTCNFYQDPSTVVPSFHITHQYSKQCRQAIAFTTCIDYIPQNSTSNMAIVRIKMPSGFQYSWSQANFPIKRTETSSDRGFATLYFDSFSNQPTCINTNGYRTSTVYSIKGGYIMVNDYYDTMKEASISYNAPDIATICVY